METDIGVICAAFGKLGVIYHDYIIPISYFLASIAMLPIIYKFIKSNKDLRASRSVFYMTLLFFIFAILTFLTAAAWSLSECQSLRISTILNAVGGNTYVIQNMLVTGLLFHRLYKTYCNTKYRLSRIHIILFIICFTCSSLFFVTGATVHAIYRDGFGAYVLSLSSITSIAITIYIAVAYIYKMYHIYKVSNDADLLKIITKVSILAITSTFGVIYLFIAFALTPVFQNMHYQYFFVTLGVIFDVYTNAIAILFMYKPFEGYYFRVCGLCHPQIHRFVMKGNNEEQTDKRVVKVEGVKVAGVIEMSGSTISTGKTDIV